MGVIEVLVEQSMQVLWAHYSCLMLIMEVFKRMKFA